MADTTFTNGVTLTDEDWFNDLNDFYYTTFGECANVAGAFNRLDALSDDTAPDLAADFVATHDDSANTGKKVLLGRVGSGVLTAAQATTSGTSIDFTGIPPWAKQITILFVGVSTNGTSEPLIQLGDAGGVETDGYLGSGSTVSASAAASSNYTAGFGIRSAASTSVIHGAVTLYLQNAAAFTWVASGVVSLSDSATSDFVSGSKSLSAALTQVRITTVGGSDEFDAGSISILYR